MNFKATDGWLALPQRRLGTFGLLVLLVLTTLVMPLGLDMYTPAIPHMTEYFAATDDMVNLTLSAYFLFFALALLVFGPLSDRYGRKPILLAGIIAYSAASVLCALSPTIHVLIAMRVVQAMGGGAVSAMSTAIVKDAIKPEKREAVLSVVQVMFVVGPVLAPVVGALILQFADWRMTFLVLAAIGLFCTVLSLLYTETLPKAERFKGGIASSIQRLVVVGKNKGFTLFLVIIGLFNVPFMAYIAVSSHIYITFFGMSELQYSLFFAAAALVSALGPFIWLAASKHTSPRSFTTLILAIAAAVGVAMLAFGDWSPYLFCAFFLLFSLLEACARPYSTNILLSQQEGDTGAASSLINFTHTIIGCFGMALAVLPWANYIIGIGVLILASMALAALLWVVLLRSAIPLKGIK